MLQSILGQENIRNKENNERIEEIWRKNNAIGLQGHVFEKTKIVFRYDLGECVYQISGLNRLASGMIQTHTFTRLTYNEIPRRLRYVDFDKPTDILIIRDVVCVLIRML